MTKKGFFSQIELPSLRNRLPPPTVSAAPLSTFLAAFDLGTTLDDPPDDCAPSSSSFAVAVIAAPAVPRGDIADLERGQIVPQLRPAVRVRRPPDRQ